jgi:hypothetical protein
VGIQQSDPEAVANTFNAEGMRIVLRGTLKGDYASSFKLEGYLP